MLFWLLILLIRGPALLLRPSTTVPRFSPIYLIAPSCGLWMEHGCVKMHDVLRPQGIYLQ